MAEKRKIAKSKGATIDPKLLRTIAWSVIGITLLVLIISAISEKSVSSTTGIAVHIRTLPDSSKLITEKNIVTTLTRSLGRTPKGIPIQDLNLRRMEEQILEKDPFISNADVYIDAKNMLHVDIEQRQPFLRIIDAQGRNYYLDLEGRKMPTSVNYTARVPVATGYIPSYTPEYGQKKNGTLRHLFLFAQKVRQDPFMNALTEQIFVTQQREFVVIPKLGKQRLLFGRNNSVEDKIKRLKIYYKEAMPYKGWQKYAKLDLRFKGQVVCRE